MNREGLLLCARFAQPPNSYGLCGPAKQKELQWYAGTGSADDGTCEILSRFTTLYPYLCLIAGANRIGDPFDRRVVEAYWIGNGLLHRVSRLRFGLHLADGLGLKKKLAPASFNNLMYKLPRGGLPHHAFHVINIWRRTGHHDIDHTLSSMEACLINWGQVKAVLKTGLVVATQSLALVDGRLVFGRKRIRTIKTGGAFDRYTDSLSKGDWVSYHWGAFCTKLTPAARARLFFYTSRALDLFNQHHEEKNYISPW